MLPIHQLRLILKTYQKRLKMGDKLPSITELASNAGIHRDTMYALLAGEKINLRSQYAISKVLVVVMERQWSRPSRLLSIEIQDGRPKINFGLSRLKINLK
jgi:hypothetical protein